VRCVFEAWVTIPTSKTAALYMEPCFHARKKRKIHSQPRSDFGLLNRATSVYNSRRRNVPFENLTQREVMMGSKNALSAAPVWQLKITLKNSSPAIWRRILVSSDTSLASLHRILQIVMGWWDCHLHQFTIHGRDYGLPDPELPEFSNGIENEMNVTMMDVLYGAKDRFVYEYDFGDSWTHQIVVEKMVPREKGQRYPVCIAGKRASPPEDCGGIWGYQNLLKVISDPKHPEHDNMIEWVGGGLDPEAFNLDSINQRLRAVK
jgi:Plasmid pRiA4b ORF-3-like protein